MIRSNSIPKHWLTILLAIMFFLLIELILQVRAHIRYGTSIFNVLNEKATYVIDEKTGLKLLRKNAVIAGSQARIETNSLGLRSPEISVPKQAGIVRIAVVGASSVMGTYTRDNNDVLAYRLQNKLSNHYGPGLIEVVNAGIAGYSLSAEKQIIEHLLLPLEVDSLIIFPGFNDLSGYCHRASEIVDATHGLHKIVAPTWLLSVEWATKNTIWLRTTVGESEKTIDPSTLGTDEYVHDLNELFSFVKKSGLPALVLTNPRAYSQDMPEDEQRTLSETARYYNPCFDTAGLHDLYDLHNALIESTARQHGFNVFRLDQLMPYGKKYFGDATHFSTAGTEYATELILDDVIDLIDGDALPEPHE